MAKLGVDCVFSYHWPSFAGHLPVPPTPERLIDAQQQCWNEQAAASKLPSVVTVSMGWDSRPWGAPPNAVHWRLKPDEFEALCRRAKDELDRRQDPGVAGRMLLIDNWNEFGEGHYVFPTREYGFGYLDALRRVLATSQAAHVDQTPEDVGLGPYDRLYRVRHPDAK